MKTPRILGNGGFEALLISKTEKASHRKSLNHYAGGGYGTVSKPPLGVRLQTLETERRDKKVWFCLWSVIGLCSATFENEVRWAMRKDTREHYVVDSLQFGTILTSLVALYFLRKFSIAHMRLRDPDNNDTGLRAYMRSGVLWSCVVDVLSLLPQPMPFLHFEIAIPDLSGVGYDVYDSNDLLLLFMFVRLVRVPHLAVSFSRYNTNGTRAIGKLNSCEINTTLLLKHSLNHNFSFVVVSAVAIVLVYSYMMMVAERRHPGSDLRLLQNCVWLIVVTMTTVGYGDVFPHTLCGRSVAVLASFSALVVFALILNGIMERLALSRLETNVIVVSERLQRRKDTKDAAARCIQRMFQISRDLSKELNESSLSDVSANGYHSKFHFMLHVCLATDVKMSFYIRKFRACRMQERKNVDADAEDSSTLAETWHNSHKILQWTEDMSDGTAVHSPKTQRMFEATRSQEVERRTEARFLAIERQLIGVNTLLERCLMGIERLQSQRERKEGVC